VEPSAGQVRPTVLIVDDHPVLRRGLAALLGGEPWAGSVVEAGTVADGARLAVIERPRLAVVDLGLPDGSGTDLIRRIRSTVPDCVVVVLTMTPDDSAVQACLAAGARGYLLKHTPPSVLVRALHTAAEGGIVLGPDIDWGALARSEPDSRPPAPLDRLSPRDLALLKLLGEGRGNAEIARLVGVSEKTVRNRLSAVYAVLGVADRVQAALLAREKGLLHGAR
jgi:two-component system, NarL family, nitrate/nitrite response regulator NarL